MRTGSTANARTLTRPNPRARAHAHARLCACVRTLCACSTVAPDETSTGSASLTPEKPRRSPRPPAGITTAMCIASSRPRCSSLVRHTLHVSFSLLCTKSKKRLS
eukprot:5015452-Pleurochrysis_carterae.AAC.1